MFSTKYAKDKRTRFSESKQGQRKDISNKRSVNNNNHSISVNRAKKAERIHTDYGEYDSAYTAHISNYPRFQNKVAKRRDTHDCGDGQTYGQVGVQSTKHNPRKNLEIKGLFRGDPVR
jgi:hypothetical protein